MPRPKLLIIDDDKIYHFLVNRLLDTIDVRSKLSGVHKFFNAREALNFLDETDDGEKIIILLDLNMPEMNGFDFLDSLNGRINARELSKVYIVTSSVNQSDRDEAKEYKQVEDFIVKPIQKSTLAKLIEGELVEN